MKKILAIIFVTLCLLCILFCFLQMFVELSLGKFHEAFNSLVFACFIRAMLLNISYRTEIKILKAQQQDFNK